MSRTIIEKIWDEHIVAAEPGHPVVFAIDLMLIHEVTSAQAFEMLESKGLRVFAPNRCLATLDHSIPTRPNRWVIHDDQARAQVEKLRANARAHGIRLYDFDSGHQGIVHVIGPELGVTQPGMTIVCGDSHTATHGAFGALAFGIGTTEVGHVLATSCLLQSKPKTMRVDFDGTFGKGVYPKDAILKLIAQIGVGGANGHVIEYTGSAVREMSMEARMTVCNMSIECGARSGLVSPDETTFSFLKDRDYAPRGPEWDAAVARWKALATDPDATFDAEQRVDIDALQAMVTWGTNPAQAIGIGESIPQLADLTGDERAAAERALEYTRLKAGAKIEGTPVEWAFLGSCTNGRIEDLRLAGKILKGRKVRDGVTMYVVPGSEAVLAQLKQEGLDRVFEEAGALLRNPGCSMCLGMNDDKVPPGQRCISTSNRNFVGRQGTGSFTHLASPVTVAASAVEGRIVSGAQFL